MLLLFDALTPEYVGTLEYKPVGSTRLPGAGFFITIRPVSAMLCFLLKQKLEQTGSLADQAIEGPEG